MKVQSFFDADARSADPGFTLIELLVTITVAGILASIAVPAFNNFVMNDRDATQINSLVYSLNYARSEAVKRNLASGVTVCPSTDGQICNATAPWSGGWIVNYVTDPVTSATAVLQAVPALAGSNTLAASGGGANGITFQSTGAVSAALTIKVCDPRGSAHARDVEVSAVGVIAASQTPGQNVNGAALTCP